jgi:hypothetical protein
MNTNDAAPSCAYAVRAEYFSDRDLFAVETFTIDVVVGLDPYVIAQTRAEESSYADPRVPDFICVVTLDPVDPNDPEPRPPSATIRPVCPCCGSDNLTRDATVRWDVDGQAWDLAGTYDCQTCERCGAEGDDFARWVPVADYSEADRFLLALIDALQNASLVLDANFQRFCLDAYNTMTIEQASAEWRCRATS